MIHGGGLHRLNRSHRTGRIARPEFTRLAFPPQWHFDVLRALDYFRASGADRDVRLTDAIGLLHQKRTANGVWKLEHVFAGSSFFPLEIRGHPSRWNTLRAAHVLRWFEAKSV